MPGFLTIAGRQLSYYSFQEFPTCILNLHGRINEIEGFQIHNSWRWCSYMHYKELSLMVHLQEFPIINFVLHVQASIIITLRNYELSSCDIFVK